MDLVLPENSMINYVVTTCGEEETFDLVYELIYQMAENMEYVSKLVLQFDSSSISVESDFYNDMIGFIEDTVTDITDYAESDLEFSELMEKVLTISFPFNGNFSDLKNYPHEFITTGEYVVQIDADEIINDEFTHELIPLVKDGEVDLIYLARENYVDGITDEYIKKMQWVLDEESRINFPDYQGRIYKLIHDKMWKGRVHETIDGAKKVARINDRNLRLIHVKNFEKQKQQNELYNQLME